MGTLGALVHQPSLQQTARALRIADLDMAVTRGTPMTSQFLFNDKLKIPGFSLCTLKEGARN